MGAVGLMRQEVVTRRHPLAWLAAQQAGTTPLQRNQEALH
ncbi:MAG: hypothetical protein RL702_119 [Pseudomonadota bacterium]|jgi:hypothetical protein